MRRSPNWFLMSGLSLVLLSVSIVTAPLLSARSAADSVAAQPQQVASQSSRTPTPTQPITPVTNAPATPQQSEATPTRIRVGVVGIDAALTPSRIEAGELILPETGAALLVSPGTTIVAAHLYVGSRPGAFAQLHQVQPGMLIEIHGSNGVELWRTTQIQIYPKGQLPGSIFDGSGPKRLALITCSGTIGTLNHPGHAPISGEPLDNLVVFAEPV
ncbi:MAG: sortase domain-containing protein [Propionibacteriaceae bacterium]